MAMVVAPAKAQPRVDPGDEPEEVVARANGVEPGDESRREPLSGSEGERPTVRANAARVRSGPPSLRDVQEGFTRVVDRLSPAVVSIRAFLSEGGDGASGGLASRASATGSGFFFTDEGLILTSQHVIDRATSIEVTLNDGQLSRATVVAADARSDLAVLRAEATAPAVAEFAAHTALRRGQLVLALGHNLDLIDDGEIAVSLGVISALGRPLPQSLGRRRDRDYGDLIQFSAPVRPGNSGGPLVDIDGRVVGIVAAAEGRVDGDGIGFAIAMNPRTLRIIDLLARGEAIDYGYLGVLVDDVVPTERPADSGRRRDAVIQAVLADGPAARAGLCVGDRLLEAGGAAVESARQFVRLIGEAAPGSRIAVCVLRDGRIITTSVETGSRPAADPGLVPVRSDQAAAAARANSPAGGAERVIAFRGATLRPVSTPLRERANLPNQALLVTRVEANSPAGRAGLMPGDIVTRVEGQPLEGTTMLLPGAGGDVLLGLASGSAVLVKSR